MDQSDNITQSNKSLEDIKISLPGLFIMLPLFFYLGFRAKKCNKE